MQAGHMRGGARLRLRGGAGWSGLVWSAAEMIGKRTNPTEIIPQPIQG